MDEKKVVDKIDVLRDLLNPHERDSFQKIEESEDRTTKMESLLAFNYDGFLKLCEYLDEHNLDPVNIGFFQDDNKCAHFEIHNKDGTISNLEFPKCDDKEENIDEASID